MNKLSFLDIISRSYYKEFKYDSSLFYCNEIEKESLKTHKIKYTAIAYQRFSEIFWKKGDYKNAYQYSIKTMQISDYIVGIKVKKEFDKWKENTIQVNDVLVMGIKI